MKSKLILVITLCTFTYTPISEAIFITKDDSTSVEVFSKIKSYEASIGLIDENKDNYKRLDAPIDLLRAKEEMSITRKKFIEQQKQAETPVEVKEMIVLEKKDEFANVHKDKKIIEDMQSRSKNTFLQAGVLLIMLIIVVPFMQKNSKLLSYLNS